LRYHLWLKSGQPIISLKGYSVRSNKNGDENDGDENGPPRDDRQGTTGSDETGPPPGREPAYSCVYSLDVVAALLAVVRAGGETFGECFHVCGSERLTLPEMLDLMHPLSPPSLGPPEPGDAVPLLPPAPRCIKLSPSQCSQLSEASKSKISEWNPFDGADRQLSTVKAEAVLGWRATAAREWLPLTCEWLESQNGHGHAAMPAGEPPPFEDEELMSQCRALSQCKSQ
jgi:hypothetical protein